MALVVRSDPKTETTALPDAEGLGCLENPVYILQGNCSKLSFPHSFGARVPAPESDLIGFITCLFTLLQARPEPGPWLWWCLSPHSSFS